MKIEANVGLSMKTQDVIDPEFKQKPVVLISDEEKLQLMGNPIYYPIFMSLRDGYKTVKEIEEDYTKYIEKEAKKKGAKTDAEIKEYIKKNKRSDKSLYRYIQHLIDADFVVPIGKRISLENPMTEKLFARTAKFFFVDGFYKKMACSKQSCIETASQLLGLIYDISQPEKAKIKEFSLLLEESLKKITSILFGEKSEEFIQIVENLSLDEVILVLQILSIIELSSEPKKYSELIKMLGK